MRPRRGGKNGPERKEGLFEQGFTRTLLDFVK